VRPSELFGITDTLSAFCFDSAISEFGNRLEAELKSVEGKNKNQVKAKQGLIINRYLSDSKDSVGRFKDPASKFG